MVAAVESFGREKEVCARIHNENTAVVEVNTLQITLMELNEE